MDEEGDEMYTLTENKPYTKLDTLKRVILIVFLVVSFAVFVGAYAAAL